MNYYVLPGAGIFGGIKVGFQFCDILSGLGLRVLVVTPDGEVPAWFCASTPVISRAVFETRVTTRDTVFFSLPHDYDWVSTLPGRKVFHCQGTDPLIEPVIADENLHLLSCWKQAHDFLAAKTGRPVIDVGISISDIFFYDGEPKAERLVTYMPRRGEGIANAARDGNRHFSFEPISGRIEPDCAWLMKTSDYYLATARNEFFGLPALEAMAAGAVVLSVPVNGGMEYLHDGRNCLVDEAGDFSTLLNRLADRVSENLRAELRHRGIETAYGYRRSQQVRKIRNALSGPLAELVSCD